MNTGVLSQLNLVVSGFVQLSQNQWATNPGQLHLYTCPLPVTVGKR